MDWPTGRVRGRQSNGAKRVGFQDVSRTTPKALDGWARVKPSAKPGRIGQPDGRDSYGGPADDRIPEPYRPPPIYDPPKPPWGDGPPPPVDYTPNRPPPRRPRRVRFPIPSLPWPTLTQVPGNMTLACRAPGVRDDTWTETEYGFGCGMFGLTQRGHFEVSNVGTGQRTYLQLNGAWEPNPIVEKVQVAAVYKRNAGATGPNQPPSTKRGVVLLPLPDAWPAVPLEMLPGWNKKWGTPAPARLPRVIEGPGRQDAPPEIDFTERGDRVPPTPEDRPATAPDTAPDGPAPGGDVVEFPIGPRPAVPGREGPPSRAPELPREDLPGWVARPVPGIRTPGRIDGAPGRDVAPAVPGRGREEAPAPVRGPVVSPAPGVPPVVQVPPTTGGNVHVTHPVGAFGPTITFGPQPYTRPHMPQPPRAREKERKVKWTGRTARITRALRAGVEGTTEFLDALDCAYEALPKKLRWEIQRADWAEQRAAGKVPCKSRVVFDTSTRPTLGTVNVPGLGPIEADIPLPGPNLGPTRYADKDANCIQPLSPQDKGRAVYRYFEQMDMSEFLKCLLGDQINDYLAGRTSQVINQQWLKNFRNKLAGIETGPTF